MCTTQYGSGDIETWPRHISPGDPRYAHNEDAVQCAANLIWLEQIGAPGAPEFIRPEKLREAISEIMGTADEATMARLSVALQGKPWEFAEQLVEMVRDYWSAWCLEAGREQIDKIDRENKEDAARERMEH